MFRVIALAFLTVIMACSAGAQWFQQTSNATWPLFGVNASNPRTATAVGDVSTIRHTTDAGQTWETQTGENGQVFAAVSFSDDSNGTIAGPNGLTVYTHNAGQSWQTAQIGEIIWYSAAHQLSPQWAIVGGVDIDGQAIVAVTTNGWQTFNSHTFFPTHGGNNFTGSIYGIHFITTEIGFVAIAVDNGEGAICRTTNGGTSWETVYWNPTALFAIDFPVSDAGQIGYAVGANGSVVKTADGGTTWLPQATPTTQQLNGVSFPTQLDGWAVGAGGTVIHTNDGGNAWIPQESTLTEDLYAVSFADADTGYAVGNNGFIIFTGNGGNPPNQPPGAFLRLFPADNMQSDSFDLVKWSQSIDPDGDSVSYIVHLRSDYGYQFLPDTVYAYTTADTSLRFGIIIPLMPVDEIFHFWWRVFATDGRDTIEASNGEGMFMLDIIMKAGGGFILPPSSFILSAYPNPFNPTTTLTLSLPVSSDVVLRVFDVTGRLAKEMRLGRLESGSHDIAFDGSDLPSGIYLAAMVTPHVRLTQKIVLLR